VSKNQSRIDSGTLVFSDMLESDLDAVMAIESRVHTHPWTRGNFSDSLAHGHAGQLLSDGQHGLLGYFLTMVIVDEVHLLDIAVDLPFQGQGVGRILLDALVTVARAQQMQLILLEVRVSNEAAIRLYQRYGFSEIGRRKHYYPVAPGVREDAIVMQLLL
jgi:ribosomal-protein-alanine N-acetyltransferase